MSATADIADIEHVNLPDIEGKIVPN